MIIKTTIIRNEIYIKSVLFVDYILESETIPKIPNNSYNDPTTNQATDPNIPGLVTKPTNSGILSNLKQDNNSTNKNNNKNNNKTNKNDNKKPLANENTNTDTDNTSPNTNKNNNNAGIANYVKNRLTYNSYTPEDIATDDPNNNTTEEENTTINESLDSDSKDIANDNENINLVYVLIAVFISLGLGIIIVKMR